MPGWLRNSAPGCRGPLSSFTTQWSGNTSVSSLKTGFAGRFLAAGSSATPKMPLAWLRLEPHQQTHFPAELRLTLWNGQAGGPREWLLATTDFHGGALEWLAA